jgi:hypothetical protein
LADESKHPDIVLLLATTGLWGEMAALRVRDIDLGRGRIRGAVGVEGQRQDDHRHHQDARGPLGSSVCVGAQAAHTGNGRQVSRRTVVAPVDGQSLRPPTTTHWFGAAVKRCQAADEKFPQVTVPSYGTLRHR